MAQAVLWFQANSIQYCGYRLELFDLEESSVDFKSVCNHFNVSAAGVEQIIVIYLIEN